MLRFIRFLLLFQAVGLGASFLAASPALATSPETLPPFGFKVFCMKNPQECRATPAQQGVQIVGDAVRLTSERTHELERINQTVNASIIPAAEAAGMDQWQLGVQYGDCEDFAIAKRHALIALGWPSASTLLSRVRTPRGDAHMVLMVRTDRGDLVLDNLRPDIRPMDATRYQWDLVQASYDPSRWVVPVGRLPALGSP